MGKKDEGRTVRLSEKELRDICEAAADAAVAKRIREEAQAAQRKKDWRLHNTKLLLEKYHYFKDHIERSIESLEEMDGISLPSDASDIFRIFGLRDEDTRIWTVKRSVTKMSLIMAHVDRMLDVYRRECERSQSVAQQRKWLVIERMYLQERRMTTNQIAREMNMEPRAIQYDAKEAREDISVLIFGIEAIIDEMMLQ